MRAIISVSDKTGVVELSNFLLKNGFTIYSTGGTFNEISDNVDVRHCDRVVQVSELTRFPEILNGRVKTLHPHIYAGVLRIQVAMNIKLIRRCLSYLILI